MQRYVFYASLQSSEMSFNINPSNWDSIVGTGTNNKIIVSTISTTSLPTGSPKDAYPYGVLLTICSSNWSSNWARWTTIQIYTPHAQDHIFVRSLGDTNGWRKITGEMVEFNQ